LYKKTQKVSITSEATLWANCRHENFCSPILRVASVKSARISETKVKDASASRGERREPVSVVQNTTSREKFDEI